VPGSSPACRPKGRRYGEDVFRTQDYQRCTDRRLIMPPALRLRRRPYFFREAFLGRTDKRHFVT
jgi:hypothetical protein